MQLFSSFVETTKQLDRLRSPCVSKLPDFRKARSPYRIGLESHFAKRSLRVFSIHPRSSLTRAYIHREKEACRSAGFSISSVLIVSTQRRHMCGKRLAIHANSFRKFNRRIRRLCRMVVRSFVRSELTRATRERQGQRSRKSGEGRGQGRPETKGRIEEKERERWTAAWEEWRKRISQRENSRNAKRVGIKG